MSKPTDDMSNLDNLLALARSQPPQPSGRLMDQVAVDSVAYLVEKTPFDDVPTTRPGWVRQVLQSLGGWPAIGGLATATCAGIWLGIYPPQPVALAAETFLGVEDVTPLIDIGADAAFDFNTEAL